jgi:hypothetical protein
MKKYLPHFFLIVFLLVGTCLYLYQRLGQGVYGKVTRYEGDCQPGPPLSVIRRCDKSTPSKTIYITEPVFDDISTSLFPPAQIKLIKTVESNWLGNYRVSLPPGTYSVFSDKFNNNYYCNHFGGGDKRGNSVCQVTVTDEFTEYNIRENYAAN